MNLETPRLLLRPLARDDKHAVFAYRANRKVNKFQGFAPQTLADVELFIANTAKEINIPDTWYQFAIMEKRSQKIAGDIGVHFSGADMDEVEIGCTLQIDFQNKGIATEALGAVIGYLFSVLDKKRITATMDPENEPAFRLMDRLGFGGGSSKPESTDLVYVLDHKVWVQQDPAA